jgi:hypothetical protein
MWLSNGQHGKELRIGDRVYLWSSGVRTEDGSIGRLIGLATVEEGSQPHPHHDWQAEFRRSGNYNPDTRRIKLFIEALVEPAVTRFQLLKVYPEATAKTAFFRNGHIQTTARVEADLDDVLMRLVQDRLTHVQAFGLSRLELPPGDLRSWAMREIAIREGQAKFRATLLLTRGTQCAVSGSKVEACLQAAHVWPHNGPLTNVGSNGILLRADIHLLFDRNLLRIDPETCRLCVSESLAETEYAHFHGVIILHGDHLDRGCLKWRWEQPQAETSSLG